MPRARFWQQSRVRGVTELIDGNTRIWREDLIRTTFEPDDADRILCIPLANEAHPDMTFWREEHSGEFTVRSAYKMLQNQSSTTYPMDSHTMALPFYKQLWELQLPNKIKILAWKVSWNFIPTMVNLHQRRVVPTAICPRCRTGTENLRHFFVECPESEELWKELNLSWIRQRIRTCIKERFIQERRMLVVRNYNEETKATKSYLHSMVTTAFETEAAACYEAVLMAKDMGFSDILVEGDSRTIINKCMTKSRDKSYVSTHISNIHSEKNSFQNISFLFVPRSANQLAHTIATISLRKKEKIYLFDAVPGYATYQSELDRPREPD
ncbi:hypothetical protein CXB51_026276 [Gossypium anomalum]|uniref:Reverse transcriptase zinc-binding domain-containing protein n=1 Tax=Gossypium anomalum TaxID=47600 RepID=A0A8J5YLE1_9ROSI|nr:hypothetical protein CXB51_026276 [Gossypium anomalum]